MKRKRCAWPGENLLQIAYHDTEWGTPVHDDRVLFEFLTLEGAQAGLSWDTILRKREGYRRAFAGFDPAAVARFNARSVERLMADPGIVRNRAKIESTITNARAVLAVQETEGSLDAFLWSFVGGAPPRQIRHSVADIPAIADADALARALKQRGFRFVGPTTAYALMQAVGMVNDHERGCFRRRELAG